MNSDLFRQSRAAFWIIAFVLSAYLFVSGNR